MALSSAVIRRVRRIGSGTVPVVGSLKPGLLITEGDSITAGYGTTGYVGSDSGASYCRTYRVEKTGLKSINYAESGNTLGSLVSRQSTVLANFTDRYGVWAPSKVLTIYIGVNDRSNGTYFPSGSAAWLTDFYALTDYFRAQNVKVLACTHFPITAAQNGGSTTTWDSWRATVRTSLLANIGTHIDGVCDWYADSVTGNQNFADSGTYSSDGIHPTDAGHVELRRVWQVAYEALRGTAAEATGPSKWDSADKGSNISLSGSDFIAGISSGGFQTVLSNNYHWTGKYYTEFTLAGSRDTFIGVTDKAGAVNSYMGQVAKSYGIWYGAGAAFTIGFTDVNAYNPAVMALNDVMMLAVNFDTGKVWIGKNGTWHASGDPAAGANATVTFAPNWPLHLACSPNAVGVACTLKSGAYTYSPPTDFLSF